MSEADVFDVDEDLDATLSVARVAGVAEDRSNGGLGPGAVAAGAMGVAARVVA